MVCSSSFSELIRKILAEWVIITDKANIQEFIEKCKANYSLPSFVFFVYVITLPAEIPGFSFILLSLFCVYKVLLDGESTKLGLSNIVALLLLFLLLFLLSIIFSESPDISVELSAAWPVNLLILFIILSYFDYRKDWVSFCFSFSMLSVLISLALLVMFFLHPNESPEELLSRLDSSIIVVPNDTLLLAIFSPFSFFLLLNTKEKLIQLWYVVVIGVCFATIVAYESRSAFIVFIFCTAIIYVGNKSNVLKRISIILLLMFLVFELVIGLQFLLKLSILPTSRLPLWYAAISMFLEHPLLGNGPFTFAEYYQNFIRIASLPDWITVDDRRIPWPHNLYLEILSGSGIICFAVFVGLLAVSLRKLLVRNQDPLLEQTRLTLLSAILGMMLAGAVELTFLRIWVLLLFFSLTAYTAIYPVSILGKLDE